MSKQQPPEQTGQSTIPDPFLGFRELIGKYTPDNFRIKLAIVILVGLLSAFLFSNLLGTQFSAMQKAIGSIILFILTGEIARAIMGWDGFWGLIIFRDKSTLNWIDRQAKRYSDIWIALADLGLIFGYGLTSWFFLGEEQKKDKLRLAIMYIGGISIMFLFATVAAPLAMPVIAGMLSGGGDLSSASMHMKDSLSDYGAFEFDIAGVSGAIPIFSLMMFVVLLLFGLAGSVLISLIMYAVIILPQVVGSIISFLGSVVGIGEFRGQDVPPPGGSPILPGVNLPFVEGILALAGLLVVHEMSHGLLARIAKVRLDSAGIVLFGILPFGAFVEPDDEQMQKIERYEENRILVAGSASNIIFSILSFFILTSIVFLSADLRLDGYMVEAGSLPIGVIVQSIDGEKYYGQNLSLSPNSDVLIVTDEGEFTRATDENGKVGISMSKVYASGLGFKYKYISGFRWIEFILNTLGLLFAVNMLVGIVNLLPIPLFDGGRLMVNGVKNHTIAFWIMAISAGAFAANLLPWIFK